MAWRLEELLKYLIQCTLMTSHHPAQREQQIGHLHGQIAFLKSMRKRHIIEFPRALQALWKAVAAPKIGPWQCTMVCNGMHLMMVCIFLHHTAGKADLHHH